MVDRTERGTSSFNWVARIEELESRLAEANERIAELEGARWEDAVLIHMMREEHFEMFAAKVRMNTIVRDRQSRIEELKTLIGDWEIFCSDLQDWNKATQARVDAAVGLCDGGMKRLQSIEELHGFSDYGAGRFDAYAEALKILKPTTGEDGG